MDEIIFCRSCGRVLSEDTSFCPYCGKKRKGRRQMPLYGSTVLYIMAAIMAVGFGIIGYKIFQNNNALSNVLFSLSAALGPVSLFGLIYDRLLKKSLQDAAFDSFSEQSKNVCHNSIQKLDEEQKKVEDLIKRLTHISQVGLFAAFPQRKYAFPYIADAISSEEKEIYIVGTSFRGLLWPSIGEEKLMKSLSEKIINSECKVRFLLTHPAFAHLRQSLEGIQRREEFHIAQEILDTLLIFKRAGVEHKDVRFVKGTPTIFGIKTSKYMLINPYPSQRQAFKSLTLLIDSDNGENQVYQAFDHAHFQGVWDGRNVDILEGYDILSIKKIFDDSLQKMDLCISDKELDYTAYKQGLKDLGELIQ